MPEAPYTDLRWNW